MEHISRHAKPRVIEALNDTRIVVIQGSRQVGKTTMMEEIVKERGGRLVSFDDEQTLALAKNDPNGFLQHEETLLAIDEVQSAPEMVLALKNTVDKDKRPGRFLITGSANLLDLPNAQDSLAGRLETIELHGFSQGELIGHKETFIDRLLSGERFTSHTSTLNRHDYLERAIAGSYPEALARSISRRRQAWIDSFIKGVVQRDAREISNLTRIDSLPMVLRVLASRNSEELNLAEVARDSEIPAVSLRRLLDLLETMYLIQEIPAWSSNFAKRPVSRPKVALMDTGVAARLINVSATGVGPNAYGEMAGHLLEGFVAGELRKQKTWAEESFQLSHFRDRAAGEIDFILETPDGRVAGIEVKASSRIGKNDSKWLAQLRGKLGKRFVAGLVLHTGSSGGPFGERIAAVPLDILWTA